MHNAFRRNGVFLHKAKTRRADTLKVGERLEGNARERSRWEQTANRKTRVIKHRATKPIEEQIEEVSKWNKKTETKEKKNKK